MRILVLATLIASAGLTTAAAAGPSFGVGRLSSTQQSTEARAEGRDFISVLQILLSLFGVDAEATVAAGAPAADKKPKSPDDCEDAQDAKPEPQSQAGGQEREPAKKELLFLAF
jgi:hypothetical protein